MMIGPWYTTVETPRDSAISCAIIFDRFPMDGKRLAHIFVDALSSYLPNTQQDIPADPVEATVFTNLRDRAIGFFKKGASKNSKKAARMRGVIAQMRHSIDAYDGDKELREAIKAIIGGRRDTGNSMLSLIRELKMM